MAVISRHATLHPPKQNYSPDKSGHCWPSSHRRNHKLHDKPKMPQVRRQAAIEKKRKVLPPISNNCIGKSKSKPKQKKVQQSSRRLQKRQTSKQLQPQERKKHEYGKQAEIMISCNLILASLACGCLFCPFFHFAFNYVRNL